MNKKTLVLGSSVNPHRYSYLVIKKLVKAGHDIIAIGNKNGKVEGIEIQTELQPYKNIDTVTIYLNAQNQKLFYHYIVDLNPKRVIFNPGAENPEFYNILKANHIEFEEACSLTLLSTNQY